MRARIIVPAALLLVASATAYAASTWIAACDSMHPFGGVWSLTYVSYDEARKGAAAHRAQFRGHVVKVTEAK